MGTQVGGMQDVFIRTKWKTIERKQRQAIEKVGGRKARLCSVDRSLQPSIRLGAWRARVESYQLRLSRWI